MRSPVEDPEAVRVPRPGRPLLVLVAGFLLMVFLGRLLVTGTPGAWATFALALPVVLVVLASRIRLLPALAVTASFALAVLSVRWLAVNTQAGWAPLLLAPVVVATVALMAAVWRRIRPAT